MGSASEIRFDALVTLVAKGDNFVQEHRRGSYKTAQAWKHLAAKLATLRGKQELWSNLVQRFGTAEDKTLRPILAAVNEADRMLEKEEARLETSKRGCCMSAPAKVAVPEELIASFERVIQAIDGILASQVATLTRTPTGTRTVNEQERAILALETSQQRRILPLPFPSDAKYVALPETAGELRSALENQDGPQVVVLHGDPGTGKSITAMHLALQYQEARQQSSRAASQSNADESSSPHFQDGAFCLDCGPDADGRAKQLELLQKLGTRPEQLDRGAGQIDAHTRSDFDIHDRLATRLANQDVLIILDDVWTQELVQQLLVPGRGIKYLITTQNRRVWEDSIQVQMRKPSLEQGRAILWNYIGGLPPARDVASQLQTLADDVIKAADFNPLVLANWGLALKGDRSTDPAEWVAAKEELLEVSDASEDQNITGLDHGFAGLYPNTVGSSTMMAVDSLPSEAQSLLLLAALCSGPTVPEKVLRILYGSIHGPRKRAYLKWRHHLEDRSFFQVQDHPVPWRTVPTQTLRVHRFRQHFIRKVKRKAISSLVQSLLGENNHLDSSLVVALSAIYGVEELRAVAAKKLGLPINLKENVNVWKCVEPFVWLLETEGGEAWHEQSLLSAKEVILQYIRKGRLARDAILRLLALPQTTSVTCWALEIMCWNWSTLTLWGALADPPQKNLFKWTARNYGTISVFKGLVQLLNTPVPTTSRMAAGALVAFAWASHEINLAVSDAALAGLSGLLARDDSAIAQEAGVRALGRLARLKGSNSQDLSIVGGYAGVLEGLVRLLLRELPPSLQSAATETLYFLAGDATNKARIIATPHALENLVELLANDRNSDAQQFAVWTVHDLIDRKENELDLMFGAHPVTQPGGIENWVRGDPVPASLPSLEGGEPDPAATRRAEEEEIGRQIRTIGAFPGMLKGLVGLLKEEIRPMVRMLAASTLKMLAEKEGNRQEIAAFPGALVGLARMLDGKNLSTWGLEVFAQKEAVETLTLLAEVERNMKGVAGVVEGLSRLTAKEVHPFVQACAARGLTLIDPLKANQTTLHCSAAYQARAAANIHLGLLHQALSDLYRLEDLEPGNHNTHHGLRFVKAMLGDLSGALVIADDAVQKQPKDDVAWAERGVVKRLMGDHPGALADLDTALNLKADVREYVTHRGYVRYLMGDTDGAHEDGQYGINLKPRPAHSTYPGSAFSLVELSISYPGYDM